jgi:hypothetical protein
VYDKVPQHSWYLRNYRKGTHIIIYENTKKLIDKSKIDKRNNDYVVNIILNFFSESKEFLFDNMTIAHDMWDLVIIIYEKNKQVNIEMEESCSESSNKQKLSQTLMTNVEENNCQIEEDGSIASTSTSSCHNNEVYLISSLKENVWIIDNDCSHHMIGDKSKFKILNPYDGETVTFDSDKKSKIIGLDIVNNQNTTISNVYLIVYLNYNLLNVNRLCDTGYYIKFDIKYYYLMNILMMIWYTRVNE